MAFNDQEIAESIRKGSLDKFRLLFDKYYEILCCIAIGYLNNKQLAEEIVNDVFCKIWENRNSFDIHTSVKAYLIRAVRNRSLNCLEQRRFERSMIIDVPIVPGREDFFSVDYNTPLSEMITEELELAINHAIESLPAECRKTFCMSRFENLKYEEIAQQQNISVNTVKTQMKIALQKLRQALVSSTILLFYIAMVRDT